MWAYSFPFISRLQSVTTISYFTVHFVPDLVDGRGNFKLASVSFWLAPIILIQFLEGPQRKNWKQKLEKEIVS